MQASCAGCERLRKSFYHDIVTIVGESKKYYTLQEEDTSICSREVGNLWIMIIAVLTLAIIGI